MNDDDRDLIAREIERGESSRGPFKPELPYAQDHDSHAFSPTCAYCDPVVANRVLAGSLAALTERDATIAELRGVVERLTAALAGLLDAIKPSVTVRVGGRPEHGLPSMEDVSIWVVQGDDRAAIAAARAALDGSTQSGETTR